MAEMPGTAKTLVISYHFFDSIRSVWLRCQEHQKNWSFGIIQFVKIILRFLEDPKVHMLAKARTATIRPDDTK